MHDSRKSLYLGMVVGVLMSGIAALAAFLYFDGPSLIDSAMASGRSSTRGGDLCDRVERFDDLDLLHELGWFANRHRPQGAEVVGMGRKTSSEICERADSFLRRDLSPAAYQQVSDCVAAAPTASAARACFAN